MIPTRDRWPMVTLAMASALQQGDVDIEVVIVDDASTDPSSVVLTALADPRVRVLRQPRPLGVSAARNRGLAAARGRWTAFLDDDDLWAPWMLRRQLAVAEAKQASVVYCGHVLTDARRRPVRIYTPPGPGEPAGDIVETNVVRTPSAAVVMTGLAREAGGFDERLTMLADWDLWMRLWPNARIACCPEPLVAYTFHRDSMSLKRRQVTMDEHAYLVRKHALEGNPVAERRRQGLRSWSLFTAARSGSRRAAATYLGLALAQRRLGGVIRGAALLLAGSAYRPPKRALLPQAHHAPVDAEAVAWLSPYRHE